MRALNLANKIALTLGRVKIFLITFRMKIDLVHFRFDFLHTKDVRIDLCEKILSLINLEN